MASVLLIVGLTACGGGGGTNVPAAAANSSASGSATLLIPAGTTAAASQRGAEFVSPSASSVGIAVNGGTSTYADISSASTLCTTVSGGRSCTVPFTAVAGSDTIAFTLYAGASGAGNVLGTGSKVTTVAAGTTFSVSVAVNGIVADVVVAETASLTQGTAATVPVTVSALDSSGNTIIGSAAYGSPITLSDSDTSGATTLSTTSVTSPAITVTLAYTGGAIAGNSFTIGATAANVASSAITPATVAVSTANACAPATVNAHLYVANDAGADVLQFGPPYSSSSVGTDIQSVGNPVALKLSHGGNLFVAPYGSGGGTSNAGSILEFAPPFTGAALHNIGNGSFHGPRGIAFDGSDNLFVTDGGNNRVLEFLAPSYSGAGTTVLTTNSPYAIALAPNCNLFVTTNNSVAEYTPPYTGSPVTVNTGLANPAALTFDATGDLFVADANADVVSEFAPPYTSTALHTITLSGSTPLGLAVDSSGNLFVCEYGSSAIAEYASPYTAPAIATFSSGSGLSLPADIGLGQ